jgi:phosphoadenosine phosphosulfate reductase
VRRALPVGTFPVAPEGVLVAYSGGKDSLATLDLAVAHYGAASVEAFFMYFVPGMDYTRVICDYAAERWGVHVQQVPHWALSELLREGHFCQERPDCPRVKVVDVEAAVRRRTGKFWIGFGYRKGESIERRAMLTADWPGGRNPQRGGFAPIADWTTRDVRAYIRRQRIAIPSEVLASRQFGITLAPVEMHWLRRHFPADYERVLQVFPYARAQADRHEWLSEDATTDVPVSGDSA